MAKGELDSLRSLLSKNPADPLEQTIFEKGPEVGFTTPAMPILTPQEGQTILPGVIASVDPGIAWDALGAQAFKLGGDLFEQTLDYLIDSKANGLADLSDMYRSKLDDAYIKLSKTAKKPGGFVDDTKLAKQGGMSWKDAKTRPTADNDVVTDGILDEIATIKNEWRQKADEVLETGKGNWYTPAVNYWDENLDMKSLGTKYQQLAVSARRADRSIMDQAEKLLFESQFANPTGGGKTGTTESVNTKFLAGLLPIFTAEDKGLREDGTKRFHTVDPTTGAETPISVNGMPIVVQDDQGNTYFNPQLHQISPELAFNAIDNADDFKYYMTLEQSTTDNSAIASYNGTLTPEYTKIFENIMSQPASTRDPMAMWKMGAVFAMLPPESVANFAANNKMSQSESDELLLYVNGARAGYAPSDMTKLRTVSPEDFSEARKIWGVINDMQLATSSGTMAAGDTSLQVQNLTNSVAVPIIGSYLGLTEEQQKEYFVSRTGDNRIFDPTPSTNLASLLSRNQLLQIPVMKAIAHFKTNPLLLVDEKGKPRSEDDIRKAVLTYLNTESTRAGIVTITDPDTKRPVSVYNPDMTWANPILSDPENIPAFMSMPATALYTQGQATRETPAEYDFAVAKNVFGRSIDRALFASIYPTISTVITDTEGVERSYAGLPLAETLRLGAACSPDVLRQYGWDGNEETKVKAAMAALADIKPASEWGVKADLTGRYDTFASTQRGGVALGFNAIPTNSGKNLFDAVINRQRTSLAGPMFTPENGNTGTPALYVPAQKPPQVTDKTFSEQLFTARRQRAANLPMYNMVTGDSIPATTSQPLDVILPQVKGMASIPELAQAFAYMQNEPIESGKAAYDFLNLNQRTIIDIVKKNSEYKAGVQLMFAEFDKGPSERKFFTPENMEKLVRAANEQGINNAFDFTSYVLTVAQAKATNKKTVFAKEPERVAQVKAYLDSKGLPSDIQDDTFFVPDADGVVLYKQGTPEFFDGIKKYTNEGYDVYSSNINPNTYFLRKPDQALDGDYTLVLPGRTPNETEAEYNTKYSQVFGQREGDLQRSQQIKSEVQKIFAPVREPSFIETRVEKQTVLPSNMVDGFNRAVQNFQYKNNIGFGNNTNKMNQIYDTMLFYDLPKLYYETGTLDYSIDALPAKYRLPGHSQHQATQPYIKRGTGTGMQTFGEIGKGLSDAGLNVLDVFFGDFGRSISNAPNKTKSEYPKIEDRFGEWMFPNPQTAAIQKAIETNDLTYVFAEMFNEPVSILRMQDAELTERINQNSANFLLLAFDKEYTPFPEGKTKEYGISKEAFARANRFKMMGWTPEQFEYQIRAATANSPVKSGAVDVDGLVLQLDPDQFIMDDKFRVQFERDLRSAMPREPFLGRTEAESARQRNSDMQALLRNPRALVSLKKRYLDMKLNPAVRTSTASSTKVKQQTLYSEFWQAIEEAKKETISFMLNASEVGSTKSTKNLDFELVAKKSPEEVYTEVYGEELAKSLIKEASDEQEKADPVIKAMLADFADIPSFKQFKDNKIDIYRLDKKYGEKGLDLSSHAFTSLERSTGNVGIYLSLKLTPEEAKATTLHESIHGMQFQGQPQDAGPLKRTVAQYKAGLPATATTQKDKHISYILDPLEVAAWVSQTKAEFYRDTNKVIRPNSSDEDYQVYFAWMQKQADDNRMKNGPFYQILHDAFTSKNKTIRTLMRETARQVAADSNRFNNNTRLT